MTTPRTSGALVVADQKTKQLFNTNSVEEIRKIEHQTRNEIEVKKEDLRRLISTRYRDLIESADTIYEIQKAAEGLASKLTFIKDRCLHVADEKPKSNELTEAMKQQQTRAQVANKIRVLVETPEQIWSAIEDHDYMSATVLYLTAKQIYHELTTSDNEDIIKTLKTLPIVEEQWRVLQQFPKRILRFSKNRLKSSHLTEKEHAGALVSVMKLEARTPMQVLMDFLSARRAALEQIVEKLRECATKSDMTPVTRADEVVRLICSFCRSLQLTVYLIGAIFLPDSFKIAALEIAHNKVSPRAVNTPHDRALIYVLLDDVSERIEGKNTEYSVIGTANVQSLCYEWIKKCTKLLHDGAFNAVVTAKELTAIETAVIKQIRNPFVNVNKEEMILDLKASQELPSWDSISLTVTNHSVDVWETFFRHAFNEAAQRIIALYFDQVDLISNIELCLSEINTDRSKGFMPEEHNASEFVWTTVSEASTINTRKLTSRVVVPRSNIVQRAFESQLNRVIEDLTALIDPQTDKMAVFHPSKFDDVKVLRAFIRQSCMSKVSKLMQEIDTRVEEFTRQIQQDASDWLHAVPAPVDYCLFIGHTLRVVASYSTQLQIILAESATSGHLAAQYPDTGSSGLYLQTRQVINRTAARAFYVWVQWIVRQLVLHEGRFAADPNELGSGSLLTPHLVPAAAVKKSWLEIKIKSESGADTEDFVPHQPSSAINSFLLFMVEELNRIGAHVLDKTIIQMLNRDLTTALVDQLENWFKTHANQLAKEHVIQFWFDTRFLFDVLSGRVVQTELTHGAAEHDATDEDLEVREMIQWKKRLEKFYAVIKQQLDPVDISFYEPHIKTNLKTCYSRTRVLYGTLTQLNRLYSETVPKSTDRPNIIPLVPTGARFNYLPVSAPQQPLTPRALKPEKSFLASPRVTTPTVPSTETPAQSKLNKLGETIWGKISEISLPSVLSGDKTGAGSTAQPKQKKKSWFS